MPSTADRIADLDATPAPIERTVVVPVPVERAWAAFVDPRERERWMMPPGHDPLTHPDTPVMDGFDPGEIRINAVEVHRRLSWSERPRDLEGWCRTTVTFGAVPVGTRITIARSGFPDTEAWRHYASNTTRGWDEHIADLVLYLETGVSGGRHWSFRSGLGATMLQSDAGVRITHVVAGGFAARAGLRAGDLVLRLNGASVVHLTDVAFAGREHAPGELTDVDYVRDGEVLHGRAPLSEWHYGGGTHIGHPGAYPRLDF